MKIYTILLLSVLLVNCTTSQKTLSGNDEIEHKIDSILVSLNKNGEFNGNVLVASNKRIIYNKGLGFSDGAKQTLLKPNHRFNIGSIYKEIPAIAIMQLKEKKMLSLDHTIAKYVKDLPEWSNRITILNLLQYTSGLPKIKWGKHSEITDIALMDDLFAIEKLAFEPGKNYLYTNYSPFLLSKIVEVATNTTFKEYVNTHIIKPLHLKNSGFNSSFPYDNKNGMAVSFNNEFVEDNPPFTIKSPLFLFSTTTLDLYKLLESIHTFHIIDENSINVIGKKANLKIDDMESPLGQTVFENDKIVMHSHHGSSGNYECLVSSDLVKKNTIIILTNNRNDNVHAIKDKINGLLQ